MQELMGLLLPSFLVIMISIAALGLGVMFKRAPLQGSCGGSYAHTGSECMANCQRPCPKRKTGLSSEPVLVQR